jgi:hypothetical protein
LIGGFDRLTADPSAENLGRFHVGFGDSALRLLAIEELGGVAR